MENARNLAENLQRSFFCFFSSRDRLKKNFEDLFFFENTCVCVLGPWPWPREGLSLALASKFFCILGLGLEPCVLDSTSDFYKASVAQIFTEFCTKWKTFFLRKVLNFSLFFI